MDNLNENVGLEVTYAIFHKGRCGYVICFWKKGQVVIIVNDDDFLYISCEWSGGSFEAYN